MPKSLKPSLTLNKKRIVPEIIPISDDEIEAFASTPNTEKNKLSFASTKNKQIDINNENKKYLSISVNRIIPGKYQIRTDFGQDAIDELCDSIKNNGLLQPIVVRPIENNLFEIIAGERRWRAHKKANLETIDCSVRNVSDQDALTIGIAENTIRENLNPIEEAKGYLKLKEDFELSNEQISKSFKNKSRQTVGRFLSLLELSPVVQSFIENGDIEYSLAYLLVNLSFDKQIYFSKLIIEKDLSRKQLDFLLKKDKQNNSTGKSNYIVDPDMTYFINALKTKLATNIEIKESKSKIGTGKILINYSSIDELTRLGEAIGADVSHSDDL
jgi:ParB family transcriptional regulator, chromosome partitioning protein